MHRSIIVRLVIITAILGVLILPLIAQGPIPPIVRGKVISVDQGKKQIKLAVQIQVKDPDAPGKVPDEMARLAADLTFQANQLEKRLNNITDPQKREAQAKWIQQMRTLINWLLSWREIERTFAVPDRAPILGLRRAALNQAPPGIRLRLAVRTAGRVPEGRLPARVALVNRERRYPIQVAENEPLGVRRIMPMGNETFLDLIGEVVHANPLVVKINDDEIAVDTPPNLQYWQRLALTLADVPPNKWIRMTGQIKGEVEIGTLQFMTVLLDEPDNIMEILQDIFPVPPSPQGNK